MVILKKVTDLNKGSLGNTQKKYYIVFLLVILLCTIYGQLAGYQFISFDDYGYVINNPYVNSGLQIENIKWAFTKLHASNWHPVTWISHMVDCHLSGVNPRSHHLTNLFFHILNTLLIYFVFNRFTHHVWKSLFVAFILAFILYAIGL